MEAEIAFADERQHLIEQFGAHIPAHGQELILLTDERGGMKNHRLRVCAKPEDRIAIPAFKRGVLRALILKHERHHAIS